MKTINLARWGVNFQHGIDNAWDFPFRKWNTKLTNYIVEISFYDANEVEVRLGFP